MRAIMTSLSALAFALSLFAGPIAQPVVAELQWQKSRVEQVSYPAQPTSRAKAPPRRRAKAPTMVTRPQAKQAYNAERLSHNQQVVEQATGILQNAATTTARNANRRSSFLDGAIEPACHNCADGSSGYGNSGGYSEFGDFGGVEASCGVGGCGDCLGEPTCGLTYGETCGCGDIGCGGACGDVCGCGDVACGGTCGVSLGGCQDRGAVPLILYVPPIQELTFFGGVQAFKGALDNGRDRGNFGLNVGVNAAGRMAWLPFSGLSYQIGYRVTQSQLHGDAATNSSVSPTQQFVTAGLFHRKQVGLQYGVVYDVLRDERQVSADFGQIRGLISVVNPRGRELGFMFSTATNDTAIGNRVYDAVDQYLLFYRIHGPQGGEFRVFGGFDEDSMGILGGDIDVPLTSRVSLQTGFSYLIPEDDAQGIGAEEEAWNLGMNLVWHYGKRAKQSYRSPFRPMFNVADNGSMFIDDTP